MDNIDLLIQILDPYSANPEDPDLNYQLALVYDHIGQTASASTHYMRAAERYEKPEHIYECLIRYASCYHRQGNRIHTVAVLLKHAICVMPKRPEAYYLLSKIYEQKNEHIDSYLYAQFAIEFAELNPPKLRTDVGYNGEWGVWFEKAVSSWWWGKTHESRLLFSDLYQSDFSKMDSAHKQALVHNLNKLGVKPIPNIVDVDRLKKTLNNFKF